MKILFVCSGNICRSPTAEGIFKKRIADAGLDIICDSAGTNGYHVGDPPDHRAVAVGMERGIDISHLQSRRVDEDDFYNFDIIYAMDGGHLSQLNAIKPSDATARVIPYAEGIDVPDPWYGDKENFYETYDVIEREVDRIISELKG